MSSPSTPSPQPGDDRNLVRVDETYAAPGFEDRARIFWERNRAPILAVCVLVVLVIVGRGVWQVVQTRQQAATVAEYAELTTDDELRAFAADHAGDPLAGVAHLRLADNAYTAANYSEAVNHYQTAQTTLSGVLADRAALGAAVARLQAGQTEEARTALEQLANDVNRATPVRAEAAYHLASLAAAAEQGDEVNKWAELVISIDPASSWTQRATMLQATSGTVTPEAAAAAVEDAPAEGEEPMISFEADS